MSTTAILPPETPAEAKSGGGVVLQRFVRGHLSATLYLGDCLTLPRIEADAIITDPPYGIDYKPERNYDGNKKWGQRKPMGAVMHDDEPFEPAPWLAYPVAVMWGANNYADALPRSGVWLVWDKKCGGTLARGFVASDAELAWTNLPGCTVSLMPLMWHGLVRQTEVGEHYHPTQKPVALMAWCMECAKVPEGATVLDPYMGSGTTGVACLRTGRNFVGIEKDPEHFATAVSRLEREINQGVLL
jgi:DNA modification methylase